MRITQINNTQNLKIINTADIYFEISKLDTFSSKFVNIAAIDYNELEKSYAKNISLSIKYFDRNSKNNIYIGEMDITCFDLYEAVSDNIKGIKDMLYSEGEDAFNIYSAIINNFNKKYYRYFGYSNERNIANITNINLIDDFKEDVIVKEIFKNIHKVIYHLLGLKVSTILTLKNFNLLEDSESELEIYSNLGFLEVDDEYDFIAKNITIDTVKNNNTYTEEEVLIKDLIEAFKRVSTDQEELQKILKHKNTI